MASDPAGTFRTQELLRASSMDSVSSNDSCMYADCVAPADTEDRQEGAVPPEDMQGGATLPEEEMPSSSKSVTPCE
jgi:hypothetical protein